MSHRAGNVEVLNARWGICLGSEGSEEEESVSNISIRENIDERCCWNQILATSSDLWIEQCVDIWARKASCRWTRSSTAYSLTTSVSLHNCRGRHRGSCDSENKGKRNVLEWSVDWDSEPQSFLQNITDVFLWLSFCLSFYVIFISWFFCSGFQGKKEEESRHKKEKKVKLFFLAIPSGILAEKLKHECIIYRTLSLGCIKVESTVQCIYTYIIAK